VTDYTELFTITYSGSVTALNNHISDLSGVTDVSSSGQDSGDVDTTLNYDISYDPELTDRTDVANSIEQIGGVTDVTLG
jgi:hypothetical protein